MIKYTPVLILTVLYALGVLLQLIFSFPIQIFFILLLIFILIIISLFTKKYYPLFFIALLVGLTHTYYSQNNYFRIPVSRFYNQLCILKGEIINYPIQKKGYTRFLIKLIKVNSDNVHDKINVMVHSPESWPKGTTLIWKGVIQPAQGPSNFGQTDYGLYYKIFQIKGFSQIKNKKDIIMIKPLSRFSIQFLASHIRNDIKHYVRQYYNSIQQEFLMAMLIGERTNLPEPIKKIFINSGTIHILAISGLHVGLITFIFLSLFLSLGIPKRSSFVLTLLFIFLYNFIVGYQEPIVRSSLMFGIMILCYVFDRDRNYLNALALSGLIILLLDPLALKSVSFQLSFLATAGIIIFTPCLNKMFPIKNKIFRFIKNIFMASLTAQILILPVLFFHFHQFPYISLLANILAIPLATLIMSLTTFSYLVFHLIPYVSMIFTLCSNFLIAVLIHILKLFSYFKPIPYTSFNLSLLTLYLLFIFLLFKNLFIKRITFLENKIIYILSLLIILGLSLFFIYPSSLPMSQAKNLEIIFFNLSGQSVLIKTPHQKHILIDSGYEYDVEKIILPFLKKNNINQIDYLILSNHRPKRNHGSTKILQTLTVKNFMDNGYTTSSYKQERIQELLTKKKIPYQIIHSDTKIYIDKILFHFLNPPKSYFKSYKNESRDIANNSLVIKIKWKNINLLLCSDIQEQALEWLVKKYPAPLDIDIVQMSYFHQYNNMITQLLNWTQPHYMVITEHFPVWKMSNKEYYHYLAKQHGFHPLFTQDLGAVKLVMNDKLKIISSRYEHIYQ